MKRSELKFDAQGLVPAIIQDMETREVRMLGFMNEEALRLTQETGRVTFWSRSRQKFWVKGETSENYLDVVEVRVDCDGDTLLILARAHGPTCHNDTTSCFQNLDGSVRLLAD